MADSAAAEEADTGKVLTGTATTGVRYVKASSIRVGDYIMIGDRACKVVTVSVSKTGKHGHAKVRFTFADIGTDCAVFCAHDEVPVTELEAADPAVVAADAEAARAWGERAERAGESGCGVSL